VEHGSLPDDVELERTTPELTAQSVPPGLLRAHRVARGVWGRLRVLEGGLRFVWEADGEEAGIELAAGDAVVIPPEVAHHVEPGPTCRFVVEFHR
jgi:tellurite resistance-related uncharacterized protein